MKRICKHNSENWNFFVSSDLPIKVDLPEWNQLSDWLKQEILEEYVVFQEPAKTGV